MTDSVLFPAWTVILDQLLNVDEPKSLSRTLLSFSLFRLTDGTVDKKTEAVFSLSFLPFPLSFLHLLFVVIQCVSLYLEFFSFHFISSFLSSVSTCPLLKVFRFCLFLSAHVCACECFFTAENKRKMKYFLFLSNIIYTYIYIYTYIQT